MLRADIPFWTILISCKHHDIQQWRMLFLITVYLSVDRWRKGAVTPIFIFKEIHSEDFEMHLHLYNLIVLVIWFKYQNLQFLLCFHHQLAGLAILACFLCQCNHINARAINRPNLSKSSLFNFLTPCNKLKELLVPCMIFLAAKALYNVRNSWPPASNTGSPRKTIGIGLRPNFDWRFNLMLVC